MQKKKCLLKIVFAGFIASFSLLAIGVHAATVGCMTYDGQNRVCVNRDNATQKCNDSDNDESWCTNSQLCKADGLSCNTSTGTPSVGCYDSTSCVDYVSKDKCPSGTTPCANDAKCASATSCSSGGGSGGGGTGGGGTSSSTNTTTFSNPITSNSIDEVLTSLLTALSGLVVTLAIIFIVLGGILYMMSAGDPGMIKRAKDCWLFSVIGLAIVVAAPTFLKQVQEILGGELTGGGVEEALTVSQIATNILNFLLSIVGIIAIISLVIAGGMYMTAYGDDTRIGTAKKMGTYAIIGIAVALVSLIAVQQVSKLITG